MKRTIQCIAVMVFALIWMDPLNVYAVNAQAFETDSGTASDRTPSERYEYSANDYVIDRYHVDIFVNENNTLDITETITAYFNVSKHGIFRTIPLKNTVTRYILKEPDAGDQYKCGSGIYHVERKWKLQNKDWLCGPHGDR